MKKYLPSVTTIVQTALALAAVNIVLGLFNATNWLYNPVFEIKSRLAK